MSINTILTTATSGLMAAQIGVRTVSDNIANATTPGYVRKVVNQSSLVTMGQGAGVQVDGVERVVDRYLQAASLTSGSAAGRTGVLAEILDRTQSLFGDPSGATSFFGKLNDVTASFAALADDPASGLERGQSLSTLRSFFEDSTRIASSLSQLQGENDTRIRANVSRANDLLTQIAKLNTDVRRAKIGGADASGSENIQSQMIDELSGLMNIQVTEASNGGMVIRTQDGMLLADEQAGKIDYQVSAQAAGFLTVTPANGGGQSFDASFSGGELVGLLEARNNEIPAALAQLSEFTAGVAREINRAHNASSSVPPPTTLTGRNTGLDMPTAINGFDGQTSIVFTNAQGVVQDKVDIAFDKTAGTITIDGVATSTTNFLNDLNTAMNPSGSATFVNGVLKLNSTTGGVVVQDLASDPSTKAGVGFSQFFGLNDLIRSSSFPQNTGLSTTDPHGFVTTPPTTQTFTLRLTDPSSDRIRDVTVTVPPTNSMSALLGAMNTGVSPYGQFALDANGRMVFNSSTSPQATLSVVSDTTQRGNGGPSLSAFFGLGSGGLASAASSYAVDPAIYQNPSKMALAHLDLTVAAGTPALAVGDARGAFALAAVGDATSSFGAAGNLASANMTVSRYASEFAGSLGRRAAAADNAQTSAASVKLEAETRRSSYEGVNMDEELIRLTTYQQAYSASARMIQAASDMYDTLLDMV